VLGNTLSLRPLYVVTCYHCLPLSPDSRFQWLMTSSTVNLCRNITWSMRSSLSTLYKTAPWTGGVACLVWCQRPWVPNQSHTHTHKNCHHFRCWHFFFFIREYFISLCNQAHVVRTYIVNKLSYPCTNEKIKFNDSRPIWLLIYVQCQRNTIKWDTKFQKFTYLYI
jgi:hypothetical protein